MAIPFIFLAVGAVGGALGTTMGVHGAFKIKDSKSYISEAEKIQNRALDRFIRHSRDAISMADTLGIKEMKIIETFEAFSNCIDKIQQRPYFENTKLFSFNLNYEEIQKLRHKSKEVSLLLGTTGSMAVGVAGGFAAAGATTSAVSVLGTASSGTAIANLSGAAATKATFAALGGGSLAAGGGGTALGTTVLGVSSAGLGLLVGGAAFEFIAKKLSDSADVAMQEARRTEEEVRKLVIFFDELRDITYIYYQNMSKIEGKYLKYLKRMINIIKNKKDFKWSSFTEEEKRIVEITTLYVGILYNMCKVQITKSTNLGLNKINKKEIQDMLNFTVKYTA